MMLDIGRHMFVMGMSTGQSRIIGMRLGIIPVQSVRASADLIRVVLKDRRSKVDDLKNPQHNPPTELQFTLQFSHGRTSRLEHKGRPLDGRELVRKGVNEVAVAMQ